ncbi:MAG: efflux RND transporter permease subunit [Prevotella sp.]|nr:efflux RND transporter permease subunit [Prevotella sp.]
MATNQEQLDQNIKENWFAKIGVQKPYTVFVCIMAIIILGVFAFSKMSVDLFPSMNLPYAVVVLSPNETYLMERLNETMVQSAMEKAATYYEANPDADINQDAAALRTILQGDSASLMTNLMAAIKDNNMVASAYSSLLQDESSYQDLLESVMPDDTKMETLTDTALQALSSVNGIQNTSSTTMLSVGLVMITLEYNSDATVDLTELALAFENIALDDATTYGTKYNKTILKIDPSLLAVMYVTVSYQGTNDAQTQTWLENNVLNKVATTVGVGTVSSNIESSVTNQNEAWEGSGDELVKTYSISIQKSSNAVTAEVCANVLVTLDKIKAENPGFSYDVTSSQGEYINQTIGSVGENLIVGGLLALLILFLFLRSVKMTLAIGISIPLALVGTFVAMYFMGINLNIISMSGLALAVGMLVDNSVVVLENIYRLRSKGFPLKEACSKGASQIMLAMLASSLTTICVFFPMFFLEGLMMQIFTDLIWVVILSLLCSFVVAVMFLPSIVATFKINPKPEKKIAVVADAEQKPTFWQKVRTGWGKFTAGANQVFDKVLRFAIDKKLLTVALALVLFVGSVLLVFVNGFILMPSTDEGTLTVSAVLNAHGQTVDNKQEELAQPLYEEVMNILGSDVEKCVVEYDAGSSILSSGAQVSLEIKLKDNRSLTTDQASEKVYKALQNYHNENFDDIEVSASSLTSSMMSSDVSVTLAVDASATADASAYKVACGVLDDFNAALEAKFADKMDDLGIRAVVYDQNQGIKIVKSNGKYAATVTIKANPSADTNQIQSKLNQYLDELMDSDQFKDQAITILDNGLEGEMESTYTSMGIALLVGFLLIYLVMVAIFQSFLMPFIILICVPLGFTGAFLLLAMCGMPLSIPALIGFLILMGVVINNGILAVDYTNQARRDGLSVKEALVSAMHTRIRPIFMTALTTVLAMVPMAFGWSLFNQGGSSAIMQPLAVVSIGGLLFGTVTTLIVVPAFYSIFCRDKKTQIAPVTPTTSAEAPVVTTEAPAEPVETVAQPVKAPHPVKATKSVKTARPVK